MNAMKPLKMLAVALVMTLGLSACVTNQTGPKEQLGGILGAAAGGYLGSTMGKGDGRLAATAAGAVIGGIIGSDLGRSSDAANSQDRRVVYVERDVYVESDRRRHIPPGHRKTHKRGKLPPVYDDYDDDRYDDDYPY